MALFTLAATALLSAIGIVGASTFTVGLVAAGLSIAVGVGLNYVAKALSDNKPAEQEDENVGGTQGTLTAGGDVPRSFGLGYHVTAGSLVYANTWGTPGNTPNGYLTQVIALSDLPGEQLVGLWVNGEKVTLTSVSTGLVAVPDYNRAGVDHLWVQYYDGTQTAADPYLMANVSSVARPWGADRIGTGICYAIIHAMVVLDDKNNDTVEPSLWTGFPTFKFELSGIKLYDPSKDATVGGSGSHVYSNPATWGGDGDKLPAVQAYNILRGIRYAGAWFYGLQNMGAARLPPANWIAQINKCRASITGESGAEPTYRAGGQVSIDSQPANCIDALLTACQGRLSEIGGFYKIHLGAPDASVMFFADADLLSSEGQTYRPFFGLADSVNGIQGTYPDPAQGWETATAPPLYRTDLEAHDGNRRLMASPQFNFVPYRAQVQRLQKSGIEEAQRARTHVIPLPPDYWQLEPGDVVTWSSLRNGYTNKLFRVDSVTDRANLDVALNITEIDPSDYNWNHATDYQGVVTGPTDMVRPPPQGVLDWFAEGVVLHDSDGISRRPAIRIVWDGNVLGVVGVQYEVRLASDLSHVTRGRTDQLTTGALIISQGLIPNTVYDVRGQYLPSSPRAMLWSDWLTVTTPAVVSEDIPAEIVVQVTTVMDYLSDRVIELEQRFATAQSKLAAIDYEVMRDTRTQFNGQHGTAMAEIAHVESVAFAADAAMASSIDTVEATIGPGFDTGANTVSAKVTANATAIVTGDAANASAIDTVEASITVINNTIGPGFGTSPTTTISAKVTENSNAIVTGDTALASQIDVVEATIGPGFGTTAGTTVSAKVTVNANAIASIEGWGAAQYAVTLDVNGYATGFELLNGGPGFSTTTFVQDKFQIAAPGVLYEADGITPFVGGAPVPIFTVANVNGSAKVAIRGDMYADGSIAAARIIAGSITATQIAADTITATQIAADAITATELAADAVTAVKILAGNVTAAKIQAGAITSASGVIGALGVNSISIADAAVTVPVMETRGDAVGVTGGYTAISSVTLNFDTVGLAGKTLSILASFEGILSFNGVWGSPGARILIDGAVIQTVGTTQSWDWFFALTGSKTFTANGGGESHSVVVEWFGPVNNGTSPQISARTLWAMVGKR